MTDDVVLLMRVPVALTNTIGRSHAEAEADE